MLRCLAFGCLALILAGLPAEAVPRLICFTAQPGDTVSELAVRLTNDARSRHEPWFQIFDPSTARVIPKSRYRYIQPGWRACVAQEIVAPQPPYAVYRPTGTRAAGVNLIFAIGWWWVPLAISIAALMWNLEQSRVHRRRAMVLALENFGKAFVREFERPLNQRASRESPVRSRLHVIPKRHRLEIFLAPCEGRSYPNLADHRKNVEYDVDRVVTLLADTRFVCGPLAAEGQWVVIPFRLETTLKEGGRS